jgi:Met-10+ like-protein
MLRNHFDQHWRDGEPIIIVQSSTTFPFYIFIYHPRWDKWTSGEIFDKGLWHAELVRAMEEELSALIHITNKTVTMLDVGANLGFFSLAAASLSPLVQVHAIEASPNHARLFESSLQFNRISHERVKIYNVGVGAVPGPPLQLCESNTSCCNNSEYGPCRSPDGVRTRPTRPTPCPPRRWQRRPRASGCSKTSTTSC